MKNSGASFLSVLLSHNDFPGAEISNLSPVEYPEGIFKTVSPDNTACVESGIYHSPFPFNEMLMSANVVFRNKGYFTLEAQILSEDGWSGWLSFGRYSHSAGESGSAAENEKNIQAQEKGIFTDTDILKTEKKASAMRFRIRIKADEGAVLRLVSFTFTDTSIEYTPYSGRPERLTTGIIDSEPVSQLALPSERATRICSPVCCSTAMRTAGINVSPLELEQKSHDNTADICGNWFLNTACAGAYGTYAFVTRLNSPEEAKSFLDLGIPVSASLTFGENELPGFYLKKTAGHFMLLRGFNEKGDAVVNDPAVPSDDEAAKTYPFKPFEKAWLKTKKGLCYIITDKPSLLFRVSVPVVSLYRKPPSSGTEKEKEELIETQLLYNESVELVCTEGKWAQIRSMEQRGETACGTRLLPHYEGWLEYSALRCTVPVPPVKIINCKKKTFENIITGPAADIHAGKQTLSIGTGVTEENICSAGDMPGNSSEDGLGTAFVVSSSGRQGFPAELRKHILKKAEYFLGDPYVWGGRSADGVDCSGLVNISYRACGIDLPRNAHGQFLVTAPLEPAELQPADLMFFSDTNIPDKIGHVMLYMGGGMLIEATQTTNNVRIVSCDEKTGVPFSRLTNGLVLPSGRSFHCGTIFTSDFLKDGILREPGNRVIKKHS